MTTAEGDRQRQEEETQEDKALAGMFATSRLTVPSEAFRHQGRKAVVAHWEASGKIDLVETKERLCKGHLQGSPHRLLVDEAIQGIDQFILTHTDAAWMDACRYLNRRHKTHIASIATSEALEEWQRNPTPQNAMLVSHRFRSINEAASTEAMPPTSTELFDRLMAEAASTQGRRFLGISFDSLPRLNKRMDGLRGLTFLAGAPGTGKTTLAKQMGVNAAFTNPDTVVVFVTCEMSVMEMLAATVTSSVPMPVSDLMKGKPGYQRDTETGLMLPGSDIELLKRIRANLAGLGKRWNVVQPADFGGAFFGSPRGGSELFAPLTALAERAKRETGATRTLFIVDSLQTVPVAEPVSQSVTGWRGEPIERDRYVIAALNDLGSTPGDAVLCISEQQKTAQGRAEITAMAGTVASGYACDSCLMLTDPQEYKPDSEGRNKQKDRDQAEGYRIVEAHLVKGRAGSKRGSETMHFYFNEHRFLEQGP
jgi:hypothetical protein